MNKKQLLTALLLSFSFMNVSYAEPSEQETIDYINAKASSCKNFVTYNCDTACYAKTDAGKESDTAYWMKEGLIFDTIIQESINIDVKNDKLMVVEKSVKDLTSHRVSAKYEKFNWEYKQKEHKTYASSALLSDLSPDIEVNDNTISVSCSSKNCFNGQVNKHTEQIYAKWADGRKMANDEPSKEKGVANKQYYTFCNAETTKKIAKALSHLIKLNGGKAELF